MIDENNASEVEQPGHCLVLHKKCLHKSGLGMTCERRVQARTYDCRDLGRVVCVLHDACVQVQEFLRLVRRICQFVVVWHAQLFKS